MNGHEAPQSAAKPTLDNASEGFGDTARFRVKLTSQSHDGVLVPLELGVVNGVVEPAGGVRLLIESGDAGPHPRNVSSESLLVSVVMTPRVSYSGHKSGTLPLFMASLPGAGAVGPAFS
jgi:hypothetical protein